MALTSLTRLVSTSITLAVAGGAAMLGYQYLRAGAAAEIYRTRLAQLAAEYEDLRATYNEAVQKTAVTELVVHDGTLAVQVVAANGLVRRVETPYDPSGEIYVDYIVRDGRLWIRRVFDADTPPSQGVVIDPQLGPIAWGEDDAEVGKAVYRALGEGRWVVSVTGSGSLGLVKVADDAEVELARTPGVAEYATVTIEADRDVESIGPDEVWDRLIHRTP
ncbi:hypothetical protein MNBD_PLANCTO03-1362 [hydrothermal vent metagenome]|uniref:Uncharacterized protein n=1 Tax=hydrothermal vent metagenome TaxID=652676 RepID=A0A3B1E3L2_9ZZZZ